MPCALHNERKRIMCTLFVSNVASNIDRININSHNHRIVKFGRIGRRWAIIGRVYYIFQLPTQRCQHHRFYINIRRHLRQLRQPNDKIPQRHPHHSIQIRIYLVTYNVHRQLLWRLLKLFPPQSRNLRYNSRPIDDLITENKATL